MLSTESTKLQTQSHGVYSRGFSDERESIDIIKTPQFFRTSVYKGGNSRLILCFNQGHLNSNK